MVDSDYVVMLRESLESKIEILQLIQRQNARQKAVLLDETSMPDDLDATFEAKGKLIDRITELDDGFELLFEKVKGMLEADRDAYRDEIKQMQDLIREITDLNSEIQAEEQVNRKLAGKRFSSVKQRVRTVRTSQKAANTYYRNMMKTDYHNPQFMDHKE